MFVTPFVAALLIGSFWTGIGTAAVVNHSDLFDHNRNSDVVITASTTDHDTVCAAKSRSYNPDTGMYRRARDGAWIECRL